MEQHELLRRAEDLARLCEKTSSVKSTLFLSPAEQIQIEAWARRALKGRRLLLHGGGEGCERRAAFFLPDWMEENAFFPGEYIRAVRFTAKFGAPGHRDYLGAAVALGIKREWLGDIRIDGDTAYIFCLPSVQPVLLDSLERVGSCTVVRKAVEPSDVPAAHIETEARRFTVMSARLDAVLSGMFRVSRADAAHLISTGAATVNYTVCERTDVHVKQGDVISLRGRGKGRIAAFGNTAKSGRQFVECEVFK